MAAILMIDDERAILELVKNGLRKDGHFVTTYTSAAQVPLAGHENSKTTMDIYAKVKYNKPEELFGVVNGAFHQAIAE